MAERQLKETRQLLTYKMLPAHKEILDKRVFGPDVIRFFKDPGTEIANTAFFTGIALGEYYGLGRLHMLALTAETPNQLANSMGAIASVSNALNYYDNLPDTDYLKKRHNTEAGVVKKIEGDQAEGSIPAEKFVTRLRQQVLTAGTGGVIPAILANIESRQPDRDDLSVLVESYFLLALGAENPRSKLNPELADLLLKNSSYLFKATEILCTRDQSYFELIYGRKSSFWSEYRFDLIPDLEAKASAIQTKLEARNDTYDSQVINKMPDFFKSGLDYLNSRKAQEEKNRLERERVEKQRIHQENLAREKADRAVNPEKYQWIDAQTDFTEKWRHFILNYEGINGPLNNPVEADQLFDLFAGSIDILHKIIESDKSPTELRAGMEAVLSQFWDLDQINFLIEGYGEDTFAQIIFLPEKLRLQNSAVPTSLNPDQQAARNKIFRGISKAAHPDSRTFPYSDPQKAKTVSEFLNMTNILRSKLT